MDNRIFSGLVVGLVVAFGLLVAAAGVENKAEWKLYATEPVNLVLPSGETERCLTCHCGIEEISPSHPVEVFGCVSCHGGNGLALEKETAHRGLLGGRNPAGLPTARTACGGEGNQCHAGRGTAYQSPVDTLPFVPMATKAGEIAEAGKSLGWQQFEGSKFGVRQTVETADFLPPDLLEERGLYGPAAALEEFISGEKLARSGKFTANCLNYCHLNTGISEPTKGTGVNPGAGVENKHLAGCAACHVPYEPGSTYQGEDPTINRSEPGHAPRHNLTTTVTYTQCNSCHNQGVHSIPRMTFFPREDVPSESITSPAADRELTYYIPQARYASCEVDLDCIDCHTRNEVMGDGHLYGRKEKAQTIRCYNCHGTIENPPEWQRITGEEDLSLWASRYYHQDFPALKPGDTVAVTDRGEPMPNVRLEGGEIVLYSKADGRRLVVPPVKGSGCLQEVDSQRGDACHDCHSVNNPPPDQ